MNKKEIAEIKKQFTPDRCAITRICGCYVNSEKEKQLTLSGTLEALQAERKTLEFSTVEREKLLQEKQRLSQEKEGFGDLLTKLDNLSKAHSKLNQLQIAYQDAELESSRLRQEHD